ncbi:MAG TPA: hypothetical protein VGU22_17665 [Methylomirabilota bacterium]|jgi:hypothetical protein|nr:hypothetical protein [Methylomirabilota bacterium]
MSGRARRPGSSADRECYLCSRRINAGDKIIALPRLALEVHRACYEYDVTRGIGPDVEQPPARVKSDAA